MSDSTYTLRCLVQNIVKIKEARGTQQKADHSEIAAIWQKGPVNEDKDTSQISPNPPPTEPTWHVPVSAREGETHTSPPTSVDDFSYPACREKPHSEVTMEELGETFRRLKLYFRNRQYEDGDQAGEHQWRHIDRKDEELNDLRPLDMQSAVQAQYTLSSPMGTKPWVPDSLQQISQSGSGPSCGVPSLTDPFVNALFMGMTPTPPLLARVPTLQTPQMGLRFRLPLYNRFQLQHSFPGTPQILPYIQGKRTPIVPQGFNLQHSTPGTSSAVPQDHHLLHSTGGIGSLKSPEIQQPTPGISSLLPPDFQLSTPGVSPLTTPDLHQSNQVDSLSMLHDNTGPDLPLQNDSQPDKNVSSAYKQMGLRFRLPLYNRFQLQHSFPGTPQILPYIQGKRTPIVPQGFNLQHSTPGTSSAVPQDHHLLHSTGGIGSLKSPEIQQPTPGISSLLPPDFQLSTPGVSPLTTPDLHQSNQVDSLSMLHDNTGPDLPLQNDSQPDKNVSSAYKQMIGCQLFELIQPSYPQMAAKITDMLLMLDMEEVLQLLNCPHLLKDRVQMAVVRIQESHLARFPPGKQKQILGEYLFPPVRVLEPKRARKITSMLLEMDSHQLLRLMYSPERLKGKVQEAVTVLENSHSDPELLRKHEITEQEESEQPLSEGPCQEDDDSSDEKGLSAVGLYQNGDSFESNAISAPSADSAIAQGQAISSTANSDNMVTTACTPDLPKAKGLILNKKRHVDVLVNDVNEYENSSVTVKIDVDVSADPEKREAVVSTDAVIRQADVSANAVIKETDISADSEKRDDDSSFDATKDEDSLPSRGQGNYTFSDVLVTPSQIHCEKQMWLRSRLPLNNQFQLQHSIPGTNQGLRFQPSTPGNTVPQGFYLQHSTPGISSAVPQDNHFPHSTGGISSLKTSGIQQPTPGISSLIPPDLQQSTPGVNSLTTPDHSQSNPVFSSSMLHDHTSPELPLQNNSQPDKNSSTIKAAYWTQMAALPPAAYKRIVGGQLFMLIQPAYPQLAAKITDMLLMLDMEEVLQLLNCPQLRKDRVQMAVVRIQESHLARFPPGKQKQILGERLFPSVRILEPERAGKITGMLLEMDNHQLLRLMYSPEGLKSKVQEAVTVLENSHSDHELLRKHEITEQKESEQPLSEGRYQEDDDNSDE